MPEPGAGEGAAESFESEAGGEIDFGAVGTPEDEFGGTAAPEEEPPGEEF